jgi:hypothetical protein
MSLFDIDVPESTKGWQNLKAAESQTEAWVKAELEKLWQSHRYNVLTEETVEAFAEANKFRRLPQDNVATNPAVRFRVETFEPSEGFQPRKPYQSRLKWCDQDGNEQSKLLLTKPETVIACTNPDARSDRLMISVLR